MSAGARSAWFDRGHHAVNRNLSLGWPWTLSKVYGRFCLLWPHEVAREWGEATWTARDLWEPRP